MKVVMDIREFTDAHELKEALGLLLDCVPEDSVVLVKLPVNQRKGTALLIEETLTDGSKVHNIAIAI